MKIARPKPRNRWTPFLYDALDDHKWHTVDQLVAIAGDRIPPEYAEAMQHRKRDYSRNVSIRDNVRRGRRYMVQDILSREARRNASEGRNALERRKNRDGVWEYRARWK